ncbi:hypothetical protein [Rhizobium sp. LjRoot98]|uniref:hypothetical protein n=1 Tax=Rhizobium sp. LjRoot98 TaxID=3342345 RepID=UPI003F4FBF4C
MINPSASSPTISQALLRPEKARPAENRPGKKDSQLTYIASPKFASDSPNRAEDCEQCLTSAFLHLHDAVPPEDDIGIEAKLVSSAVEAGWDEHEVRRAVERLRNQHLEQTPHVLQNPGYVPSSSL